MKEDFPICLIKNDKFTICFKTTQQMFYHLYRLMSLYGDEINIELVFDNKSQSIVVSNKKEANYE